MDKDCLKACCLMVYLDRLPLADTHISTRIKIAYLVSLEIETAIEKRGLIEVEAIALAVHRRVHPFVRFDLEMDQRQRERSEVNNETNQEVCDA